MRVVGGVGLVVVWYASSRSSEVVWGNAGNNKRKKDYNCAVLSLLSRGGHELHDKSKFVMYQATLWL